MRSWNPDCEFNVVVSEGAARLVSNDSVGPAAQCKVYYDQDWVSEGHVMHRYLADWADVVLVAPASMAFFAQCALLLTDTLSSFACCATEAPVFVAQSIPEVLQKFATVQQYKKILESRGWTIYDTRDALSVELGTSENSGMIDFTDFIESCVTELEKRPVMPKKENIW